ncbi:MAG: LptF/LptG family permease [Deltaproteobacteria bacterium]|nr:LptF/LptG family permease [Deltaproteobacteria bacterium]
MRLPRILSRYVLREVVAYGLVGFFTFATILVAQNLLRRLEDLLAIGFGGYDFLVILGCFLAMFGAYAAPVAFLFGVLLAMGRLSSDSEVTAMQASGLGLRALVVPVVALGVAISAVTAWLLIDVEPAGRRQLRTLLEEVASRGGILEPGKFRGVGERMVFVTERDRENNLRGVMISDRSDPARPYLVFAERGRFVFEPETLIAHLQLERGDVHLDDEKGDPKKHQRIAFEGLDYAFDVGVLLTESRATLKAREMPFGDLRALVARFDSGETVETIEKAHLQQPVTYRLELHRRLALPLAPILFALVGVPLGLRRARGARSWGALLCIAVVFAYYAMLSLSQFLGGGGVLPPVVALWLPNLAFAALAVALLLRARSRSV